MSKPPQNLDLFGVINFNKPKGLTSHDVVARVRRVLNIKRVGHLGTLDPMATGVLPICVGSATRLIEYFPTGKSYRAEITLGITTDTLDAEGQVLAEQSAPALTAEQIEAYLAPFRGTIEQQVPLFSAVHVEGKKLYQLAHKHRGNPEAEALKKIELPTKTVTIYKLELLGIDNTNANHPKLTLEASCSSGTYIRALARDLGAAIGCGAHLSGLVRTAHGEFGIETALDLEAWMALKDSSSQELGSKPEVALISPLDFLTLTQYRLHTNQSEKKLLQGQALAITEVSLVKRPTVAITAPEQLAFMLILPAEPTQKAMPLAVVKLEAGYLKPVKVFGVG